ncbi:MAG TPA: double zinc ribbon domain-containing protein [Thermoanaerobaculia bacterium]
MFTHADASASGVARGATPLARFLFPSRCLSCRRRDVERLWQGGICAACWNAVEPPAATRCAVCDEPVEDEAASPCGRCRIAPPAFESLRSATPYRGAGRQILLAFKFRGADYLARHLAARMCERLPPPEGIHEIACVPAASRWRREDHAAELLAGAVAARLGRPFARRRLVKTRDTERQSRLALTDRERNVRDAFRARRPCPENILLVDDVATSGATARECARALARAGARRVLVWCFARASRAEPAFEVPGIPEAPSGPD